MIGVLKIEKRKASRKISINDSESARPTIETLTPEQAMINKSLMISRIIIAASLVSACSGTETLSHRNWGKSYETVVYNQTLNPDADKSLNPVDSLDGQAAENNLQKYRDGFKVKEGKQPINLINLK